MTTPVLPTMVALPAGEVTLTDRRTRRAWSVDLAPYRLGATAVTRAQYAAALGSPPPASPPVVGDAGALPVETVSFVDAVRFCNALSRQAGLTPAYVLTGTAEPDAGIDAGTDDGAIGWVAAADGYRLPTEAEWEYACRAGTSGPRYGELDDIAWYRGNSDGRVHEVAGKRPNGWGLYDMIGNVWDWCWDVYDREVYGGYRVLRGGGWFDEQWSCRASVRRRSHPSLRIDDVGFRVARSAAP